MEIGEVGGPSLSCVTRAKSLNDTTVDVTEPGITAGVNVHFASGEILASIAGPSEQVVDGDDESVPLDVPFWF